MASLSSSTRILVFAGSLRKDSYNKKLARIAADAVRASGAEATLIDLREYPLPVYDQEIEDTEGLPSAAKALKKLFLDHQGLLLSCPEYNSSISGALKNTLDWVSREEDENEKPLACFTGKTCALLSASPGGFGGLRGLVTVRMMLGNLGVLMLPDQLCVSKAHEAFNEDGSLKEAKQKATVEKIAAKLVRLTAAVSPKETYPKEAYQ